MSPLASFATYLAAAGTLVGGGAIGFAVLVSPVDADSVTSRQQGSEPGTMLAKAVASPEADNTPFRYGPEVNHRRGDGPINAAAQARKAAQSGPVATQKRITIRPVGSQRPPSSMAMTGQPFAPSVPSSGH